MCSKGAILLAAGLSRRMGAQNKLLLAIDDEPLVRRVARMYLSVIDVPLTVVTGFEADRVRGTLEDLAVQFYHNPQYAEGQSGSVATGLRHAPDTDLLMIGLADQPLLNSRNLRDLIAAHSAGAGDQITVPYRAEQRGNPIVVPRALRPRLTENQERPGCMRFTRDHPELVQFAQLDAPGFYADIDTPSDFAKYVRYGAEVSS